MAAGSARSAGRHGRRPRRPGTRALAAVLVAGAALALTVAPAAVPGPGTTASAAPVSVNVALTESPTVSASSQDVAAGQGAAKAVDGSATGYPDDPTKEWATVGGLAGSWIELTWPVPVTVDRVVLHDRPNLDDRVTAGTLSFSSGGDVAVGALADDGGATTVTFGERTVSSLRLTIDAVSASTANAGLSELEVWGYANSAPVADAGPDQAAVTDEEVQLDGTASDDVDGDELTYSWAQTGGTPVSLSSTTAATPEFTAPWVSGVLTFSLVVEDGLASSDPDSVTVAVSAPGAQNVARTADPEVSASSEDASQGQDAAKAVDGSPAGYPEDSSAEWATTGEQAGAWIELEWAEPVTIDRVVLHDRPNQDDRVVGGVLEFSDASLVQVGALADEGAATIVRFRPRTVTSLRFTVTAVSPETVNVGLAELEAWGRTNTAPVADAGSNRSVNAGSDVELNAAASHDADGDPLTYAWSQVSGTPVALSDDTALMPTFTAPTTPGTLVFSLTVDDGTDASTPDEVTMTVLPFGNVARGESPTVAASSEDLAAGQGAAKAIDGSTLGYPVDETKEWATLGGGAGSWIELRWDDPVTVDRVVLFDRPNAVDQVTGGTIAFSDGSTVDVPELENDGSATPITFATRTITSLRLTISAVSGGTVNAGLAEIEVWGHPVQHENVARSAAPDVTASSEDLGLDQGAVKAVDGSTLGYPVDDTKEWATVGGGAGSWIELTWPAPVRVDRVVLHDRPNSVDHATGGRLDFSDGTDVSTGGLANDGSATPVAFSARTVTSVRLTITDVSAGTENVGLAEIEVWGFEVPEENVARTAAPVVTASSADTGQGQGATKAVDGSTLGYPVDATKEWATVGGGAGSWIELTWPAPVRVDRVVAHDRPNTADHVTAATLRFSDGEDVATGALDNDGAPTVVAFSARTVTSVRLEVTAVGAATENVGLAEIEVWGYPSG